MTTPTFHAVEFRDASETAAFVAALSRYLSSPRGKTGASAGDAAEVWVARASERPLVYLNDRALAATAAAFAAPVVVATIGADVVTRTSIQVIAGDADEALGVDDVARRLTVER